MQQQQLLHSKAGVMSSWAWVSVHACSVPASHSKQGQHAFTNARSVAGNELCNSVVYDTSNRVAPAKQMHALEGG